MVTKEIPMALLCGGFHRIVFHCILRILHSVKLRHWETISPSPIHHAMAVDHLCDSDEFHYGDYYECRGRMLCHLLISADALCVIAVAEYFQFCLFWIIVDLLRIIFAHAMASWCLTKLSKAFQVDLGWTPCNYQRRWFRWNPGFKTAGSDH